MHLSIVHDVILKENLLNKRRTLKFKINEAVISTISLKLKDAEII